MPITPYHFGFSGLIALVFKNWLNLPILVLANVAIDIEVLLINALKLGNPVHRYAHTLLGAAVVGLFWGVFGYYLTPVFRPVVELFKLPYSPGFKTALISGVIGAWSHVLIDGLYHYYVNPLWPARTNYYWRWFHNKNIYLHHDNVKNICLCFWAAALLIYLAFLIYNLYSAKK